MGRSARRRRRARTGPAAIGLLPRRYVELFAQPSVRAIVVGGFAGRLGFGFYTLALILVVEQKTNSFAAAGAVTAAFSLGVGAAPLCARVIDRFGARVLLILAAGHALAIFALAALLLAGAPLAPLLACTWCAGFLLPPVGPVMRTIWRETLADPSLRTAAISFESVTMEVVWLIGPLFVAVAAAAEGLLVLLALGPVLTVAGTTTIVVEAGHHVGAEAGRHGAAGHERHPLGALRSREVRSLVLDMFPVGVCLGCVEVSVAAFATAHVGTAYAGVLLATLSVGGITSGLVYGARAQHRRLRTRFAWLVLGVGLVTALLSVTTWISVAVPLLIAFGGSFAIMLVVANQLVAETALPGTVTEAFTWSMGMTQAGAATGATFAGLAVQYSGAGAGFAVGALAALTALPGATYLVRRAGAPLQAAPAPGESGTTVPLDGGSPSSQRGWQPPDPATGRGGGPRSHRPTEERRF